MLKMKKKKKFRWWYIPLGVLGFLIMGAAGVYVYVGQHIGSNQDYIGDWDQISGGSSGIPSESEWDSIKAENYPILKVAQKDPNIENILIIGSDSRGNTATGGRSDTMIVVSVNTKDNTIKLTSLMRDIKAYFPDKKEWGKLNAAFAYGGAGQAVNIINYNFELDIQKYLVVNFSGFEKIINTAGGVTLHVTNAEAGQIPGLYGSGTYLLNGSQALAYARIRNIDSDFARVQRQRNVITALLTKFQSVGLSTKTAIANDCLKYVKTNISSIELLGKLSTFYSAFAGDVEQYTVPQKDMYTSVSSPTYYLNVDWDEQLPALSNFIYGK
jgi:LCP family protein required for cell wall assembly